MTLLQRRYCNGVICASYRQPYRATIESDVETTPREASKLPRLAKTAVTWRWCAPPACHLAYSTGPEPAKRFCEKSWSEKLTTLGRIVVSRRDQSFHGKEARNRKSCLTCDSQTTVTYLCRVRVLPTSLPMKQWGSAENREGVARRATLVDMLAPAQPLIIH